MEKVSVTPWDVSGEIDYNKLIKNFGVKKIDSKLLSRLEKYSGGELPVFLRRKTFFAQRDLKWLFDKYDNGEKFVLYTGCGPSGPIHLGHLGTCIFNLLMMKNFCLRIKVMKKYKLGHKKICLMLLLLVLILRKHIF
jgi:tryptophanyl-tRNA synthetase